MNSSANPTRDALLDRLVVVLAKPAFSGNIGATARVMANFGVRQGVLVAPRCDMNSLEARQYATGISAVTLATMSTVGSLREALVGASSAVAVTRRTGKMRKPSMVISDLSQRLSQGRVCVVFGPEESGLTEEDLSHCSEVLTLDVSDQMPSMNLSHAVAVTLSQLFAHLSTGNNSISSLDSFPEVSELTSMTDRLREMLQFLEAQSFCSNSEHLAHILTSNLRRARPNHAELAAWQGFMSAILKLRSN